MTSTTKAKRPIDSTQGKARERYGIDPRRARIIAYDTAHGAEHPLWRADAKDPVDENMLASMRKRGQIMSIRARKIDNEDAMSFPPGDERGYLCEVVVGRKRVKAARVLHLENEKILLDVVLFPTSATDAEIAGTANAENYIRVVESLESKIEHMHQQYLLEGADEAALQSVAVDFGVSAAHVRSCLALRGAGDVMRSLKAGEIKEGVALAIAPLKEEARATELAAAVANPDTTVDTTRERVSRQKAAAKATKAAPASGAGAPVDPASVACPMSKGTLSRLARYCEENPSALSRDLVALLDVVAGKQPPTTVEGLAEAMRAVGVL